MHFLRVILQKNDSQSIPATNMPSQVISETAV